MSWNFDTNSGNGKKAEFTKFPVGITKIKVIDDVPNIRWVHWMPQFSRTVNCPGKSCPICEIRRQQKANKETLTYSMTRRFAVNAYNYETKKVEIMEQGIGFFEDLRDLKDDVEKDGNTLQDAVIKVKRRGTGKDDTSYRLDIDGFDKETEIPEGVIDLNEYFQPHEPAIILRLVNGETWDEVFAKDEEVTEERETVEIR